MVSSPSRNLSRTFTMNADSLSVVARSDALSKEIDFLENDYAFESCRENIKKRKHSIPFTWCIKNVNKLNYFMSFKSPLFRIAPSDKRIFRMELGLEPRKYHIEAKLFMDRGFENLSKKTFCVLSRYAVKETGVKMEEIVRHQVTFSHSHQLRSLIFENLDVQTTQVEMDMLVIHIETNKNVAFPSRLPGGSSSDGASETSPPDNGTLRLVEDMERLLLEPKFADVSLCSEDRVLRVHRNILSGRSAVFDRMFHHPTKESQDGRVDIVDVDFATLQRLVAYMYSGRLAKPLSYESAMALFVASDKYDVPDLLDVCAEVIVENLSIENCVDIAIFADSRGHAGLMNASAAVLAAYHKEIWQQPDNSARLRSRPDVMKVVLDVMSAGHDSD